MLYVYDIETYPNVFTCTVIRPSDNALWRFEISERCNNGVLFYDFLTRLRDSGGKMVGYNNVGFDYPIIHDLICKGGHVTAYELFAICDAIINGNDRWGHTVRESDHYVPQIDLFKIHHFDNKARSTSLKVLEFNMQSVNIQDLPFPPGIPLTLDQLPTLIEYNDHDVYETVKFLKHTMPMIEFRATLTERYGRSFTNHNDTKIGKDYFTMALEQSGVACYDKSSGRKQPRQTPRHSIDIGGIILPYISFNSPEFTRVLEHLRTQVITETKGIFKNLNCTVESFQYDFGTGGIHGSVESQIVAADDYYALIDLDVASYYPNLSIANNFYPEHLSDEFCRIYQDMYQQRRQHKKGTPENAMLKLALNGVYGDSNNPYSPFYDPLYTMAITINGQLLLCMLAEMLSDIPGLSMVQINTDGLTVRLPRAHVVVIAVITEKWERLTKLTLERADYSRMFIRDVNNYIGEYTDGKLKRKGAYCYGDDLSWHQNYSSQIVAIAAEAALVRGVPVRQTIEQCDDMMLFMRRTKVPRSSRLMIEPGGQVQNITRYYVSHGGGALIKIMPPTSGQVAKNPEAPERRIGIDVGWTVTECNNLADYICRPINYEYYIKEANKLVEVMVN